METYDEFLERTLLFRPNAMETLGEKELKKLYERNVESYELENYLAVPGKAQIKDFYRGKYQQALRKVFDFNFDQHSEVKLLVLPSFTAEIMIHLTPKESILHTIDKQVWNVLTQKPGLTIDRTTKRYPPVPDLIMEVRQEIDRAKIEAGNRIVLDGTKFQIFTGREDIPYVYAHSPREDSAVGILIRKILQEFGL